MYLLLHVCSCSNGEQCFVCVIATASQCLVHDMYMNKLLLLKIHFICGKAFHYNVSFMQVILYTLKFKTLLYTCGTTTKLLSKHFLKSVASKRGNG